MPTNRVEAVVRALTILNCFSPEQPHLSLKELAEQTGFYKSTILRLAGTLEEANFLIRHGNGRFQLGTALLPLGNLARTLFDEGTIIRPILNELRDRFNESVAFYIRRGERRTCLYRANANRAIRHHLEEGQELPLNQGASGHLLRAHSETDNPRAEQIRRQGWYVSYGERDPEVAALAVPVISPAGELLGALSISGLKTRISDDFQRLALPLLKEKAQLLSQRLPADFPHLNSP
jgi:DNA-binding IclR family transcriptional regulator